MATPEFLKMTVDEGMEFSYKKLAHFCRVYGVRPGGKKEDMFSRLKEKQQEIQAQLDAEVMDSEDSEGTDAEGANDTEHDEEEDGEEEIGEEESGEEDAEGKDAEGVAQAAVEDAATGVEVKDKEAAGTTGDVVTETKDAEGKDAEGKDAEISNLRVVTGENEEEGGAAEGICAAAAQGTLAVNQIEEGAVAKAAVEDAMTVVNDQQHEKAAGQKEDAVMKTAERELKEPPQTGAAVESTPAEGGLNEAQHMKAAGQKEDVVTKPAERELKEAPQTEGGNDKCIDCGIVITNKKPRCKDCFKKWRARRYPKRGKKKKKKNSLSQVTALEKNTKAEKTDDCMKNKMDEIPLKKGLFDFEKHAKDYLGIPDLENAANEKSGSLGARDDRCTAAANAKRAEVEASQEYKNAKELMDDRNASFNSAKVAITTTQEGWANKMKAGVSTWYSEQKKAAWEQYQGRLKELEGQAAEKNRSYDKEMKDCITEKVSEAKTTFFCEKFKKAQKVIETLNATVEEASTQEGEKFDAEEKNMNSAVSALNEAMGRVQATVETMKQKRMKKRKRALILFDAENDENDSDYGEKLAYFSKNFSLSGYKKARTN